MASQAANLSYVVVCEMGAGNFSIDRYETEEAARAAAKRYWVCWLVFQQRPTGELQELCSGGVGLEVTRIGIRRHANAQLNPFCPRPFINRASKAIGDSGIPVEHRVPLGIIFPMEAPGTTGSVFMFFDKTKPLDLVISGAARHAGLVLEKGKIVGSPEKLNLFTLEGENVRPDLEIDAHLGSTLQPAAVLILEKGNRVETGRLKAVHDMVHAMNASASQSLASWL